MYIVEKLSIVVCGKKSQDAFFLAYWCTECTVHTWTRNLIFKIHLDYVLIRYLHTVYSIIHSFFVYYTFSSYTYCILFAIVSKQRKDLNLSAKIEIIKSVKAEKSVMDCVPKYRCGKSAVYNILKRKRGYVKELERNSQNGGVKLLNWGLSEEYKIIDEKTFVN